ncbi:MAG: hypothetical protein HC869_26150 [Rhodospirillales bacterium]|nr:hypothetical protein [Rhodospirillales bacterium]
MDGYHKHEKGGQHVTYERLRALGTNGFQEPAVEFKVNNGRTNHVWQNAYLDQDNEFMMDRWPYPFIEMNPDDMSELKVAAGDLVEVYNDDGSTQAMVYPTPTAKKGHTFMLFAYPTGVQGNVVNAGTNELILPNYKQPWARLARKICAPSLVRQYWGYYRQRVSTPMQNC